MPVTRLSFQHRMRPRLWAAALAVGSATLLSACAYDDGYYGGYDAGYGYGRTVVYDRYGYPPPMRVEHRSAAPSPHHVWVNGDWRWGGSRYNWHPGRWEAPGHYVRPGPRPVPPTVRPEPRPRPPQWRSDERRPDVRSERPRPPENNRYQRQPAPRPGEVDRRMPWDHRPEG